MIFFFFGGGGGGGGVGGQGRFDIQFDKRTVWERILTPHSRKMRR